MDVNEGIAKLWFEKHLDDAHIASQDNPYQVKKIKLSNDTLKLIQQLAQKEQVAPERLVVAAWGFLLNHFSASDNLLIGFAQSPQKKTKQLPFIPPLGIINSVTDKNISVKSFLKNFSPQKKLQKQNFLNEDRYLVLLKSDRKVSKDTINYLQANQYPLVLYLDNKIKTLSLHYHAALYDEIHLDNLLNHFEIVIQSLCQQFNAKIQDVEILTPLEKKFLLTQWSKPSFNFEIEKINLCSHQLFSEAANTYPDAIAVQHNDASITYQELQRAVLQLAAYLIKHDVQPNDHIAVLMERTPTLILAMLAIHQCGAVYVPINAKYPDDRINFVLEDCDAKFILVNDLGKISEKNKDKALIIPALFHDLQLPEAFDHIHFPEVQPNNLAYILYTSGTTGKPKGVTIQHASLMNFFVWYRGRFNINHTDRASQFASAGFDAYLCETIPFLACGASVHIVDDNIKLTPSLFIDWLQKNEITVCDLTTAYAKVLFNMPWPNNLALRTVKIGGEHLTQYPTKTFPFDIWNCYGPTETTIEATYAKIYSANSPVHKHIKHPTPPIGKPIVNSEMYVVNHFLKPVAIGVSGELVIGGVIVSAGYLNRIDLNTEKFISLPFTNHDNKFYRTGDLVRWLEDGNLEFIGRIDHQIKLRGYRIELGDIESAISQHADVNEVVVLAKENIHGEKTLIAYVVPNLDKERYLYQERCLISMTDQHYLEAITEDISKEGIAVSGLSEMISPGTGVKVILKLPGFTDAKSFMGHVIWQQETRCGISFELSTEEKEMVNKSIDYYLSTHNVMELVLTSSAKRSLRKALKRKLPEYMVPSTFVTLLQFPLTFSGKIDLKALPPPQDFEQILQKENIPAKTETEKRLQKIWSNLLHQSSISMSDNFFDLGGNSIKAAELSVSILNQFNISIPTKILFDLPFIPILSEYIDSKGQKYKTESFIQEEIHRDGILPDNIVPTKQLSPSPKYPKHILLTGAGGFLGVYLLRELLQSTDAKIYCLIRKGEFETAAKRLIVTLEKFHLDKDISLADRRIVIIPSDISFDRFGLPLEQYNMLLDRVDLIYHCGAQVNIMASYNKLRGSNVQGTLEVIKFASTGVIKPIHYVSTLSAACNYDEAGSLTEVFPDENYDELFGGYAISKWVSERLLTQIKNRGIPSVIYRSGYIAGQSDTGMTNLNDALFMLIKGCIQLGYAPEMDEKITILPVDYVSKAIVQISLHRPDASQVYHIDHPTGIMWTDLIAWLNDYGYRIKIIPIKKWQEMLLTIPNDNPLFPFLPYYLAMKEDHKSPDVNVSNAARELKKLNLPYPEINEQLLTIYFDYLCEINYIPMPNQVEA